MTGKKPARKPDTQLIIQMISRLLQLCDKFEASFYSGRYYDALLRLRGLMAAMRPDDRPKDALRNVDHLILGYDRYDPREDPAAKLTDPAFTYHRAYHADRDLAGARARIWQRYSEVLDALHENGYFDPERWGRADPTAGDKKSGAGKHKPMPGVMSSRIEEPKP